VLLDRRRVKFWQKWIFLFMAILMASFLIFGYSGVARGCGAHSTTSSTKGIDQDIKRLQAQVKLTPGDAAVWQRLGDQYQLRANSEATGSTANKRDLTAAAFAYEKSDALLAKTRGRVAAEQRVTLLGKLLAAYSGLGSAAKVVSVYDRLTKLQPNKPDWFLYLGIAARDAGQTSTAVLALTRYLELFPKSPEAAQVRAQIAALTATSSTPTPTPSTTK
jgi:tetratricopeptide (TPR) repeat protein